MNNSVVDNHEDVQARDNIRNQITVAEVELKRMNRLKGSEEYAVNELVKARLWHEEEVAKLKATFADLQSKTGMLEKQYEDAVDTIAEADEIHAQLDQKREAIATASSESLSHETEQRDVFAKQEDQLIKRESSLTDKEDKLRSKLAKLKELIRLASELQEG